MSAIKFSSRKVSDASTATTGCAIIPLYSDSKLSGVAAILNKASGGAIKTALELGDFAGKSGQSAVLPGAGKAKRLLLVGCGEKKKFDRSGARSFVQALYKGINSTDAKDALLLLDDVSVQGADGDWLLEMLARSLESKSYRYTETVSKPKPALKLTRMVVSSSVAKAAAASSRRRP